MFQRIFHHYWIYLVISLLVILPGLISLIRYGVKPSIDFTGGSLVEVQFQESTPQIEKMKEDVKDIVELSSVQQTGKNSLILRSRTLNSDEKDLLIAKLNQTYPGATLLRYESVGPILGRELLLKTLIAVVLVSVVITLYIMRQFTELKYGVSAVLAMFHDTIVLFSVFSWLGVLWGVEVDVLFVTAVLTTLSFSVHDTIVFFDRIRELRKKQSTTPLKSLVNTAVLQTMSRSINNSMTIIIMLLSLVLLGGESIRWFSVALLVGAVTGTYSSTFTAVPLLLLWEDIQEKQKLRKQKQSSSKTVEKKISSVKK